MKKIEIEIEGTGEGLLMHSAQNMVEQTAKKNPAKVYDPVKEAEAVAYRNKDKVLYEAIGGKLDLTSESKVGPFFKRIMKMAADDDESLDPAGKNDLRDWDQITKFTQEFAARVKK